MKKRKFLFLVAVITLFTSCSSVIGLFTKPDYFKERNRYIYGWVTFYQSTQEYLWMQAEFTTEKNQNSYFITFKYVKVGEDAGSLKSKLTEFSPTLMVNAKEKINFPKSSMVKKRAVFTETLVPKRLKMEAVVAFSVSKETMKKIAYAKNIWLFVDPVTTPKDLFKPLNGTFSDENTLAKLKQFIRNTENKDFQEELKTLPLPEKKETPKKEASKKK